jgi:hypothetical protein
MGRAQLEMAANFLIVLYLVTHGVAVPAGGRGHLLSGFYLSIRAWAAAKIDRFAMLLSLAAELTDG